MDSLDDLSIPEQFYEAQAIQVAWFTRKEAPAISMVLKDLPLVESIWKERYATNHIFQWGKGYLWFDVI
jgi:hypothetical protein